MVALGKIGLPLAVQIAGSGTDVVGSDINPDVVESVNAGRPPFPGEPELEERLSAVLESGALRATTSTPEAVASADVVIVVVPLVVDEKGHPQFSGIDAATVEIGGALRSGQIVIYETTLPIGTTRDRFGPILEQESRLVAGEEFHLAFSPERVSSGTVFRDLGRYPKLVGGIDDASEEVAAEFYERCLSFDSRSDLGRPNGAWRMGSAEAAEFAKLAETTYRDVNIALANEFAAHAEERGLDMWDIVEAANSQPYSHIHRPGISVGGHCIPVYPRFYLAGDAEAELPAIARSVNERQPDRAISLLESVMGTLDGRTVAVLGAAYRGGVKETAFSGVYDIVDAVTIRGGTCVVHDPLYDDHELASLGLVSYVPGDEVDAAVIQADHDAYPSLRPADLPGCRVMVDGRGILSPEPWEDAGIPVLTIGRGRDSFGAAGGMATDGVLDSTFP